MEAQVSGFVLKFVAIIWEAFPFVVLGAIVAGILEEVVPQQAIAKLVPKNPILAVSIGALLGLVFPMCECGIVPVMRRLLRKGLPLGTCVAYMLAGPIINVVVITSTYVAFVGHGSGRRSWPARRPRVHVVAPDDRPDRSGPVSKRREQALDPLAAPPADKTHLGLTS